jgi:signal transduction histidine kinase
MRPELLARARREGRPAALPEATPPTRVLVVEDDVLYQELLKSWLAADARFAGGARAATLDEARRHIQRGPFDIIVLDLNLPDSHGLETLAAVRRLAPETPVVVLTAEDDDSQGLAAVRQGAHDYMDKGVIDGHGLRQGLRYACERVRHEQLRHRALQHELEARRLRDVDRAKNRFYQTAARGLHEPLQPLRFGISLLRSEIKGPSRAVQDALSSLESQVAMLDNLIANLVDVAAIQTGSLELHRQPIDLSRLLIEAVERWDAPAQTNRLALDAVCDRNVRADVDPRRIHQVLDHLMQNAVRLTPGGGQILVELRRHGDVARIRVRDTGVGIEPDEIESLFEIFQERGPEEAGTRGIGLAFCKGVIEAHGGAIRLESGGPGRGTTVTCTVPVQRD